MKIAVLTPISHLPGVRELLQTKGEVTYLEEGTFNQVRALLSQGEIDTIICNPNQQTYKLDKDLLEGTNVSLINTCSTGMNHIDQEYCKEAGIEIYSLTKDRGLIDYLPSTSELALGLMMSLLRRITQSVEHTKNYEWDYTQFVGRQVDGLKIGVVGFGRLGKMFAKFVNALGAEIFIYDPYEKVAPQFSGASYKYFTEKWNQVDSLEELFETCDVISLHVHVSDETKYMINEKLLAKSKKSPYIINTSRGEIVDEKAIINALESNLIAGYGTDVVEDEFGTLRNSPIIRGMKDGLNIIVTPHTGGMTIEGQTKAYTWAINKL